MSGNVFFNPISSHSQWFIPIPIPNPTFSLALFPFPSHSRWLFPFPPAAIPVLLVVSRQITNEQCCYKKKKIQPNPQQYTSSIKASSVSWTSRVKPNLRVYNKLGLLCKNKSGLTVSDDQLGEKWENVEFLFPIIPIKPFPFPFPFP